MGMRVIERDHGANALLERLSKEASVKVGIIGKEASAGKTGTEGLTVAEVASFHEFGLGVPQRSWLRAYVDENEGDIRRKLSTVAKRVAKGAQLDTELDRFGLIITGEIQARIVAFIPPELAKETEDRKGSVIPLINTGQLKSSITHLVVHGGDDG